MGNLDKKHYSLSHKAAKLIVFVELCGLYIVGNIYGLDYLEIVGIALWLFSINTHAYIIENILHWKHSHTKL